MDKQIITIQHGGTVSGLQRKAGQGLNLQTLGHAVTGRVSEIVWHVAGQGWYVLPVAGPYNGLNLTEELWHGMIEDKPEGLTTVLSCGTFLFSDYDLAVKAEVRFLDTARLSGIF